MKYNPDIHHRRSIRLKGYDYSRNGAYFITICTQNRVCLFGGIEQGEMILNDAGKMVHNIWDEIPAYYEGIEIDAFQIMPNHIHGIIVIVGAGPCACPDTNANIHKNYGTGQPRGVAPTGNDIFQTKLSLPDIVHRFKTLTTKKYIDGVKQHNWQPFDKKLWQRNYYEHIIRDEESSHKIQEYIMNNPREWERDELFIPRDTRSNPN